MPEIRIELPDDSELHKAIVICRIAGVTGKPEKPRPLGRGGCQDIHTETLDVVNRFGDQCRVARYKLMRGRS